MSGGQQQHTLHDSGIGWAILLVIIAVLVWLFWMFFDVEVRNMVRWIRYAEMWIISWFLDSNYTFEYGDQARGWFNHFEGYNYQFGGRQYYEPGVSEYEADKLAYLHMAKFSAMAMQPLRWPFIFLLGAAALWCMFMGPNTQYRRKHSLEGLIEAQSRVFPAIMPFVKFNPAKQPPRPPGAPVPAELPPFAEALGPEEWLAYNEIKTRDKTGKAALDEESVHRAFRKQLGRPWRGVKAIDPYKQILIAAFCLKAARKRTEADDMLGRLARCWTGAGLNLSKDSKLIREARAVLKNKDIAGKTLAQANKHAYETTAITRALQFAREEGGVLAPAQFVWLRAHNRDLWYPLNNLGRQAYHMEALGAMSHYKAERLTQRPIPVPKVDHAVQTIREYMASAKARPIPQLDYSNSTKRGVKKAV